MSAPTYEELLQEREALRLEANQCREVRERLRQSESKLERLLNNIPGAAYRCSLDGGLNRTLEYISRGARDLLGYAPEELVSQHTNILERLTDPDDERRIDGEIRSAILERTPYRLIYRITLADGEQKWVWDQGEAVYTADGAPMDLEGIMIDVSAQKLQEHTLQMENERLRGSLRGRYRFGEIIGKSEPMQQVYRLILKAAASDTNVTLHGDTGTGKDLVASTIHGLSERKGKFVPVNCGAIPEQLMESEFFGHKRGAFTGATADRAGYLAAADEGTLFLDELGELPLGMQVKLLRALESKQYTPVGDTAPRQSNFRIIAATNRDLKDMVRKGTMRPDFFYRIHVLPIHVPALRERREDIPLLVDHFLARHVAEGEPRPVLPAAVRVALEDYDWPGNVRELQNVLDRYVTFGEINFADVRLPEDRPMPMAYALDFGERELLRDAVARVERAMLVAALDRCRWRRGEAAQALGLNLRTMQRKMKHYGV